MKAQRENHQVTKELEKKKYQHREMYFITFCLFKERLGRLMGLVGYLSFVSYARATRGISVNLTFHFIFSMFML